MSCRKQVSSGTMAWGCNGDEGHEGPCFAREVIRSVRNRQEWEAAQRKATKSSAPHTLEDLGMQGKPQTFSIDPDGHGGRTRRLHPEEFRRLQANGGEESPDSLENQIVNTAGGVDITDVIQKDPRYAPYEKREQAVRGNEWKEWEEVPEVEDTGPSGFQAVLDATASQNFGGQISPEVVPTKQRPGDQPLPYRNNNPSIQDLVIEDIENRKHVGLERYGTLLQANNGRNALLDAYEEAIDLCMYLKQALVENE